MSIKEHPWHSDIFILRAAFTALQKNSEDLRRQVSILDGMSPEVLEQLDFEYRRISEARDRMLKLYQDTFPEESKE